MLEFENIDINISEKQKREIKNFPFLLLKNDILGKDFELSVTFVSPAKAKQINIKYRQKDYIPNTLSFPYSDTSGEIFMQIETIYSQAMDFELSKKDFLLKIYIHSLLHLKGLDHGTKMENAEAKYIKNYSNTY